VWQNLGEKTQKKQQKTAKNYFFSLKNLQMQKIATAF